MPARRDVDWLEFHLVLTAVLTRATHERALIGHRETDFGRSHAASSRQSTRRSRSRHELLAHMATPGPAAPDLVLGAPHRELRACRVDGRVSTNSILISAKAAAHAAIGGLFHIAELVTAAPVMRYDRTAKGP